MLPPLRKRDGFGVLFTTEAEYREYVEARNQFYIRATEAAGFKPYVPWHGVPGLKVPLAAVEGRKLPHIPLISTLRRARPSPE